MKPPELFAAHYQRFKLNLIRRAHNALYELGLRRRICVRFNEVLSDTYRRHFIVKLVDTRGKWRNFFDDDTRATQGPLQKKGQGAKFIQRSLQM